LGSGVDTLGVGGADRILVGRVVDAKLSNVNPIVCLTMVVRPASLDRRRGGGSDRGRGGSVPRTVVEHEPRAPAGSNLIVDAEWAARRFGHPHLWAQLNHATCARSVRLTSSLTSSPPIFTVLHGIRSASLRAPLDHTNPMLNHRRRLASNSRC
jgi:hypothetical protein